MTCQEKKAILIALSGLSGLRHSLIHKKSPAGPGVMRDRVGGKIQEVRGLLLYLPSSPYLIVVLVPIGSIGDRFLIPHQIEDLRPIPILRVVGGFETIAPLLPLLLPILLLRRPHLLAECHNPPQHLPLSKFHNMKHFHGMQQPARRSHRRVLP